MGSAPLPLFERVILAPVRGRPYSGPAALPLLTQVIDVRSLALHFWFFVITIRAKPQQAPI
jgi:hypothetical protein